MGYHCLIGSVCSYFVTHNGASYNRRGHVLDEILRSVVAALRAHLKVHVLQVNPSRNSSHASQLSGGYSGLTFMSLSNYTYKQVRKK